jgi:AGZA family xanthine/uracil permease-like MFS transporter
VHRRGGRRGAPPGQASGGKPIDRIDQARNQEEIPLDAVLAPIGRYFKFADRKTNILTETRAGLTTFMVMAYIIFVNPSILSLATGGKGPDYMPTVVATCLVAGIMTIVMGVVANYPFAMAAGMGLNAVVAFDLILSRGMAWEDAMAVIVWEGLIITVLVVTGLRESIMRAIPMDLKRAIGIGIGLFILFIGLVDGGFVKAASNPPVGLSAFLLPTIVVFVFGLAVALALMARKIPGALLISIFAATVLAIIINYAMGTEVGDGDVTKAGFIAGAAVAPDKWFFDFSADNFSTLFKPLSHLGSVWTQPGVPFLTVALVVFSLMLSDFFDTMGTVIGVGEEAGLVNDKGELPGIGRVLLVDSLGAVAGGLCSTSSNTTYIESAAGVSEGGRTGFSSIIVGALFLVAILFAPIAMVVPTQATAPALVVVGYLMFTMVKQIKWGEIDDLFPILTVIIVMPLTYSITNGIAAGFVAWVFLKVVTGKIREIHPLMWIVSAAFVLYFATPWIQALIDQYM